MFLFVVFIIDIGVFIVVVIVFCLIIGVLNNLLWLSNLLSFIFLFFKRIFILIFNVFKEVNRCVFIRFGRLKLFFGFFIIKGLFFEILVIFLFVK